MGDADNEHANAELIKALTKLAVSATRADTRRSLHRSISMLATDFTNATLTDQPSEQGAKALPDAQPAQRGPIQEQQPGDSEAMQQREGIARMPSPALPSGEQARVPSITPNYGSMPPVDVPSKSSPRAASVFSPSSKPFRMRPGWNNHLPKAHRQRWTPSYNPTGSPFERYDEWMRGKDLCSIDPDFFGWRDEESYERNLEQGDPDTPAQWVACALAAAFNLRSALYLKLDPRRPAHEQLDAFAEYGWADGPPSTSWLMTRLTGVMEEDLALPSPRWCGTCRTHTLCRTMEDTYQSTIALSDHREAPTTVCTDCEFRCSHAQWEARRTATAAGGSAAEIASASHAATAATMPVDVLRSHVSEIIWALDQGQYEADPDETDEYETNIIKLCRENQTNTRLREDVERRCRLPAGALHARHKELDSMVRPILAQFMDEFVDPADPDDACDDYDDVVDDCASVATDSTMGYEKDDDGEFGAY